MDHHAAFRTLRRGFERGGDIDAAENPAVVKQMSPVVQGVRESGSIPGGGIGKSMLEERRMWDYAHLLNVFASENGPRRVQVPASSAVGSECQALLV